MLYLPLLIAEQPLLAFEMMLPAHSDGPAEQSPINRRRERKARSRSSEGGRGAEARTFWRARERRRGFYALCIYRQTGDHGSLSRALFREGVTALLGLAASEPQPNRQNLKAV